VKIGNVQLRNNLIVAPMAGVTDRPFRVLCKRMGAGMAVSEMVASNSLLWGSEKTIRRGNHDGEVEPKVVQIAGADPAMMAEAAKYNADKGASIIGTRTTATPSRSPGSPRATASSRSRCMAAPAPACTRATPSTTRSAP
jgi:hypothetical protein